DVRIPELDGFEVLERVCDRHLPVVIFVTAFDEHAVRAFEVHALDYLLKPVAEERFQRALARARAELQPGAERESPERLSSLLGRALDRLAVREGERYVLVRVEEVRWFQAAGNYIEVHVATRSHLMRGTLRDLERRLDPGRFARIHRQTIVNVDRVKEVVPTVS